MAPNPPVCSFIQAAMAGSRSTAPLNRSNSVFMVLRFPLSYFGNPRATIYNFIREDFIAYSRQSAGLKALLRAGQGGPVLSRLPNVFLHHGRALRSRRHDHDLRPGGDADLSVGAAVFLVHSGVVGLGGADYRHA